MRICSCHFYWNLRAVRLLLEDRIKTFYEDRFDPTTPDFREFRICFQYSVKIDLLIHEIKGAMHVTHCTRNAERNIRERGHAIFQHDVPLQIRHNSLGIPSLGIHILAWLLLFFFFLLGLLALGSLTQIIHLLLCFWFREMAVRDPEITH